MLQWLPTEMRCGPTRRATPTQLKMNGKDPSIKSRTRKSRSSARSSWRTGTVPMRRGVNLPMGSRSCAKTTNTTPNTKQRNVAVSRTACFAFTGTGAISSTWKLPCSKRTTMTRREFSTVMLKWKWSEKSGKRNPSCSLCSNELRMIYNIHLSFQFWLGST